MPGLCIREEERETRALEEQATAAKNALREKAFLQGDLSIGGCTSFVQRKLQCGYNRAATILDMLVQQKVISEPDATGRRHLASFNPS